MAGAMARKTVPTSRTRKPEKPGAGFESFNTAENSRPSSDAKPICALAKCAGGFKLPVHLIVELCNL
jgi:hypothetical protein